jgi:hypothetical protein
MQVAVIEEDLQFIAQILQEQLRAEIPSGEFFQVKCAVKNDQLMILVQHPQGVSADTDIFLLYLRKHCDRYLTNTDSEWKSFSESQGSNCLMLNILWFCKAWKRR